VLGEYASCRQQIDVEENTVLSARGRRSPIQQDCFLKDVRHWYVQVLDPFEWLSCHFGRGVHVTFDQD
jgi:hypothetical protein